MPRSALRSNSCLEKTQKKTKVPFLLEVQFLERKTSSKVVKHIFNESFIWNEQVEYRRSKAFNRLFRLKRNTLQSLIITAKVLLYRAITNLILLFGSEYWELKKTEHNSFKNFNAEALKWTYGNMNYIDSVFSTNLLPPFSTRLLRINGYCTVDLQSDTPGIIETLGVFVIEIPPEVAQESVF